MNVAADTGEVKRPREQEQLWPARQHPNELILPEAHSTRFPGTWVAIFENGLPMDQVNALELEGYYLYKRVSACPNGNLQIIIREEDRPDREGAIVHEKTQERYKQYNPRK